MYVTEVLCATQFGVADIGGVVPCAVQYRYRCSTRTYSRPIRVRVLTAELLRPSGGPITVWRRDSFGDL